MRNLVPRALCAAVLAVGVAGGSVAADAQAGTVSASRPSVAGFLTSIEPASHEIVATFTVPTITCTPGENSAASLGAAVYATDKPGVPFAGVRLTCVNGSATYQGVLGVFPGHFIWPVLPGDKMRARVSPPWTLAIVDRRTSQNAISGWPVLEANWGSGSAGAYSTAGPLTDFTSAHFGRLNIDRVRATRETTRRSNLRRDGVLLASTSGLSQQAGFTVTWEHD